MEKGDRCNGIRCRGFSPDRRGGVAMKSLPYDNFNADEFIIRDWLALDRTVLANERTFLAYGRTSLALMAAGITLIKVFESDLAIGAGWGFVVVAVVVFGFGVQRFLKMQGHYRTLSAVEDLPSDLRKEYAIAHTGRQKTARVA